MRKNLIEQIQTLEKQCSILEPDKTQRNSWNEAITNYTDHFLNSIASRKVYQSNNSYFYSDFDKPTDLEKILSELNQALDNNGIDTSSGRYLGFIPGGGLYPSALGDFIAALTNRYSGIYFAAPGAILMENEIIRWMADMLGFPKVASGNLTSGGSMANLIAVVTAREYYELKAVDYHRAVIYLTRNTHTSAQKSLRIAGMGEAIKRYIPVDNHFCMNIDKLTEAISVDKKQGLIPWMIYASAGTTDTGSVDSLEEIALLAKSLKLWLHVDAAYGGFFALTEIGKELFKGIEKADSITLDPHKSLFLPYGTGAILVRHHHLQRSAFTEYAPCLQDCMNITEELSPCDLSPELTRHFRALRLWMPLKLFGIKPFRAALQEKLLLTTYFYEQLQKIPKIQIACSPHLTIVTFRYLPDKGDINEFNQKLIKAIQDDGRVYFSSTNLNDDFYLRMACLSFRTHLSDIELALQVIREHLGHAGI